jgi:hypothetical protein
MTDAELMELEDDDSDDDWEEEEEEDEVPLADSAEADYVFEVHSWVFGSAVQLEEAVLPKVEGLQDDDTLSTCPSCDGDLSTPWDTPIVGALAPGFRSLCMSDAGESVASTVCATPTEEAQALVLCSVASWADLADLEDDESAPSEQAGCLSATSWADLADSEDDLLQGPASHKFAVASARWADFHDSDDDSY